MSLVGNLGFELNDIRALSEQGQCLLCSPHGTGKGARLHNPLDPLSADHDDHAEQTVPVFELRRLIDKESGIKAHNAALSTRGDSATGHIADCSIARTLTQINVGLAE